MTDTKPQVTIIDVAKLANTSTASVSKVLNDRPGVSKDTKKNVLDAIEKLNYQTNHIARSLRMSRSFSLGIITDDIEGVFTTTLVRGVEDSVRNAGFNVFLCNSYGDPKLESDNIEALLAKQVDGLILMNGFRVAGRGLPAAKTQNKPVVYLYQYSENSIYPSIIPDDRQGAVIMVEHLVGLGHRSIGVIGGPINYEAVNLRLQGYKDVLAAHGLSFDPNLIKFAEWNQTEGYKATNELINLPNPPSAIFTMSDLLAIGAEQALIEKGLRIPQDISLAGFDNRFFSKNQLPPLTTVELPLYEMGVKAGQLLHQMISGESVEVKKYIIPCKLIVRSSTQENKRA